MQSRKRVCFHAPERHVLKIRRKNGVERGIRTPESHGDIRLAV